MPTYTGRALAAQRPAPARSPNPWLPRDRTIANDRHVGAELLETVRQLLERNHPRPESVDLRIALTICVDVVSTVAVETRSYHCRAQLDDSGRYRQVDCRGDQEDRGEVLGEIVG